MRLISHETFFFIVIMGKAFCTISAFIFFSKISNQIKNCNSDFIGVIPNPDKLPPENLSSRERLNV